MVLTVILSTLTSLLDISGSESASSSHSVIMKHVLSLASTNPSLFKEAVSHMSSEVRSKLEACVRNSVMQLQQSMQRQQQDRAGSKAYEKEPTIQLKTNFGSF